VPVRRRPALYPGYSRVWGPERRLDPIGREVESLFFDRYSPLLSAEWDPFPGEGAEPRVDLRDEGDRFVLQADMPGMTKDDVEISVGEQHLELRAQGHVESEDSGEDYVHRVRGHRSFYRNFTLPDEVVPDKAGGKMKDGMPILTLPKRNATPRPTERKVKIT